LELVRAGQRRGQAVDNFSRAFGQAISNFGILNSDPKNQRHQHDNKGILHQSLAVFFLPQPFKKVQCLCLLVDILPSTSIPTHTVDKATPVPKIPGKKSEDLVR
jgi:hypothetical protein